MTDGLAGCLLGQALGDALGLPREGLSRRRGEQLYPDIDQMHFWRRRGFGSDDTEHACITGNALLRSGGEVERFIRSLGWGLRWWLASGPPGIGLATLRACLKLWVGVPPTRSGVFSAGNGPLMRATIIGAALPDAAMRRAFCDASTRVTHTDPKAVYSARLIADAAALALRSHGGKPPTVGQLSEVWADGSPADPDAHEQVAELLREVGEGLAVGWSVDQFAESIGLGKRVSGYVLHTLPVALFAFLRHPDDYWLAVQSAIRCGGDTDTVGAVVGALSGARLGRDELPFKLVDGFADWPRSVGYMGRLAKRLAESDWRTRPCTAEPLAWWAVPGRNLVFVLMLLPHVARRLMPPY